MPQITLNSPDYIGSGFASPLHINVQGGIQLSSSTTNIEESIYIILRTSLGERVYRPTFGSRLAELMYEPLNLQTLLQIRLYIEEALEMWEPRIRLKGIQTEPDPIRGKVNITISYQPKESHDIRSLIYPFYLASSSEEPER